MAGLIKERKVRDVAEKVLWRAENRMEMYESRIDDDSCSEDYLEGLHAQACDLYGVYILLQNMLEDNDDSIVYCKDCKYYAKETEKRKAMCKRTNSEAKYDMAYCFYGKRMVEEEEE